MGAPHNAIEFGDEHDFPSFELNNRQLKTREVLQRLKMAWIALWFRAYPVFDRAAGVSSGAILAQE